MKKAKRANGGHRWVMPRDKKYSGVVGYVFCHDCGVCKRADGKNRPCRGHWGHLRKMEGS